MKRKLYFTIFCIALFTGALSGQDCSIISKANDITPDRLCSPVSVIWEVSFRGVNDGGTKVQIQFDWDDGTLEVYDATNVNADITVREWAFTATHTYTSDDDRCNYHPVATLIVNGQLCTSSSQEQIVTVWDNDNSNGGRLNIDPTVYPICVGNGANVRFQDNTQFNCVPPQENDVPNTGTRWIQWVYGTAITMTGQPVTINGNPQAYPYYGNINTLHGPVTGSGIFSEVMNVADDKLIGQYFQVTLRYWNYCNPYDDPLIPGPPADAFNGDHDPMTTTARILIVDYPDATINPHPPVCDDGDTIYLTAANGGGRWSGNGIVDEYNGAFVAGDAGVGDHIIRYNITDANGCSGTDTVIITVAPGPDATITPVPAQCNYHDAFDLVSAAGKGTWSGTGIIDPSTGTFSPGVADTGLHSIKFVSEPDENGCLGRDEIKIRVRSAPSARFLTNDSAWCERAPEDNTGLIKIEGTEDQDYDLIWQVNGTPDTLFGIDDDTLHAQLPATPGMNTYRLRQVIENFEYVSCASKIDDVLKLQIYPGPDMKLDIDPDGVCSPVGVEISSARGNRYVYTWDFGDGTYIRGDTSFMYHTYYNNWTFDTTYSLKLTVETQHGCVDSINQDIPVYPNPRADFFVNPLVQDYPETTVDLINYSSEGNWMYLWDFDDGTTSDEKRPVRHEYETYGEYFISLKTYSEHCADSLVKNIRILPPPPVAAFSPDTAGCGPVTVQFENVSLYAETFLWEFDDGSYSTEKNPVHTFVEKKEHKVSLTVTGPSGVSQSTEYITVYPDPDASFKAYPRAGTRLDQLFRFVNRSVGAERYLWDFGDGNTSTESDPAHEYGMEGLFNIQLIAWNEFNCPDTMVRDKYIKVIQGEGEMVFPNAFRWNGTGPTGGYWTEGSIDNTVFHPHFENVVEYNLVIYSRWGEKLYESHDLFKGWDGYFNNADLAPQGVYVYKAWVEYVDGRREVKVGDVTFLH